MKKLGPLLFTILISGHTFAADCSQRNSLPEIKDCIESLPPSERGEALLASLDKLNDLFETNPTDWEKMHLAVSLAASPAKMTGEDAVELYRKVEGIFNSEHKKAKRAGKQLIFLGGEEHNNRSDLLFGLLLNHAARKAGAKKYGFEVAVQSLRHGTGPLDLYRGLADELDFLVKDLRALPSETEPLSLSYLGGVRHNREFALWHLLRQGGSSVAWQEGEAQIGKGMTLFAADPMFWNWAKYPNNFGYNISREPLMVTTLIETAEGQKAPVVATYGRGHFMGIAKLFPLTGRNNVQISYLNFGQTITVFNTKFSDPLQRERWLKNQEIAVYEIKNLLKSSNHILLGKQGPQTAKEAYDLFKAVLDAEPSLDAEE